MANLETMKAEYDAKRASGKGRERHVWGDDMVAHIWANQSQSDARNGRNTFYFTGATIFSYGGHFPIARHCTSKRGEKFVLFTERGYSSTTSGHKCRVQGACRHLKMVYAHDVIPSDEAHEDNRKIWEGRIPELVGKIARAKANKAGYLVELERLIGNANEYSRLFGLRWRLKMPKTLDLAEERRLCDEIAVKEAARQAKRLEKYERERDAQRAEDAADRQAWLDGGDVHYPYSWRGYAEIGAELRIKGDVIQTSWGAEVPLAHALKILPLLRSGREYKRNGHTIHLGHFALDEIDAEGNIVAGCHKIKRTEIERVAATIGA
jgi:hypothetical protein